MSGDSRKASIVEPAKMSKDHPEHRGADIERFSYAEEPINAAVDADIVDFDGPDDPDNAMNWPPGKKAVTLGMVTIMTLLSPIGSTISAAAAKDIMLHFNSTSNTLSAFVTTVYLLGWVCGPIVIAPLSELYGRAVLYKVCIVLFLLFNVACAVANSLASLIEFRLLAGIASSCPVTLGTGSIADMMPAEKRAGVMGAYVIGVVLGPTIGPIAGGYLTPALGWRWAFWLMAIIASPLCAVVVIFMQESYPFVLLQRKTIRLRKESGNARLRSALDNGRTTHELFRATIFRPFKMLLMPIVFLLSLYTATVYSYLYLCFTTFPQVFSVQYGLGSGPSGLATLGLGVGSILGVLFCGGVSNKLSAYLTKKTGGEAKPEYRLPSIIIGGVCVPIGLFWYGWTADNKVLWILPIIGTGFLGAGRIITYMATTLYLVDAYTAYAASVTASSTVFRCLCATFLPLAGPVLYERLGVGWGTSLLGFVAVAFIPLPCFFYIYGERIRKSKQSQAQLLAI